LQPSPRLQSLVNPVCALLPELEGKPIAIRLEAVAATVHAGTNIRKRVIALDPDLAGDPAELARILIHEVFHFAWVRLGNVRRNEYAAIVMREFKRGARGELGWSSEYRKAALIASQSLHPKGGTGLQPVYPKLREYICESFCDTAAWRYGGLRDHDEFTLGKRYRHARNRWFAESFDHRPISI
jgi:hypothetical protein